MRLAFKVAAILTVLFVTVLIFTPVWACGCKMASAGAACMSNLKQLSIGLIEYANDYDERLANRDLWMDQIVPYVKDQSIFVDPLLKGRGYGRAFNGALSNATLPEKHAEKIPMIYDSLNPIRNASDRVTSLPVPGRHSGGNMVAYADGHAKRVPTPKP